MSRWRIDRKIAADARLGWEIATAPPVYSWPWWRRWTDRALHVAVGGLYFAGVSTLGWPFWIRARPVPY